MKLAVLVDFDGTIAKTDASYAVLDRFGDKEWLEVENKALAHEITLLEALRLQAGMVKAGPREAERYLKDTIEIRDGFREFALWCRDEGIHLEICSDGFSWTIEVLLSHWELEWIPWTSNHTVPKKEGWTIEFPYLRENCRINANCKCSHYERLKESHETVLFVGDGITDECVSRRADVVFARDRLLETCVKEGVDCIPWTEWKDVHQRIMNLCRDQF